MANFLALLGWAPGDDRELLSIDELIASFSLEGISGGNAVFNTEKLDWMNGQYIGRLSTSDLADAVRPLLQPLGVIASHPVVTDPPRFATLLELLRPRAKRLTDFGEQAEPLLREPVEYEAGAVEKHLSLPGLAAHIDALALALGAIDPFTEANVEGALRDTAAAGGLKAGPLIHATRVAMTGRTNSPGLFELLVLLGRERTLQRLARLSAFLGSRSPA